MRSSRWALGMLSGIALSACGGSNPPPLAALAPAPSSVVAPVDAGASASEPPASPDLLSGIKAFDSGNYPDARKSFEAATRKNPGDYEAFYNLGLTCERLGDKPTAEAAYKSALGVKADLESAAAELCALYVDEGRLDDALAIGHDALAKHPGSAILHENVGVALATRGDRENANRELEEATNAQPSEPMFHLTLAHWLTTWRLDGAAPHLDAALGLVKDDYGMIATVGHEYRMAGKFEACVKTFDHAIQLKDGGEVRTERALCRLGLKDEKGTLEDLQAAVAKESTYATAHFYLGGRLAQAKRFKDAIAEYARYLELAPKGSLAKPAIERMKAAQDATRTGAILKKK